MPACYNGYMFFVWTGKLWLRAKGIAIFVATMALTFFGMGWLWGRRRPVREKVLRYRHPTPVTHKNWLHRAGDVWNLFSGRSKSW
jgi:hypothetical protein